MLKSSITCIFICIAAFSFSQEDIKESLKIYLDCNRCDDTYIKQNLGNVQFVRDQNLGDVHLFFIIQRNGSGGDYYEIDFIGKNDFEAIDYKLSFSTDTNMTSDDVRKRTLEYIKIGLVRFWIEKNTLNDIKVEVPGPISEEEEKKEVEDPWDYWVFGLSVSGYFNGQETSDYSSLNSNVSVKRVTEKNKFSLRVGLGETKQTFTYEDEDIVSINSNKYLNIYDVISINNHWSYGVFGSLGKSTFGNYDSYWSLKPAIEYNFFKYDESAKKQVTLSYRNGVRYNDYIGLTVFAKNHELLWEHSLLLGGSVRQSWGNINGEVSFEQFLHDTTLNAFGFYLGLNIRVFKGFSFNVGGNYRITRNQINIEAGGVTIQELLLQQQQLQSGYNYWFNVGLNYSFGSIYNTIVNPRFNF
jgi:hypothetical protein